MKIQIDRTNTSEGNLVFTITVSEPHHACFGDTEKKIMELLETCKDGVDQVSPEENKTKLDVVNLIHNAKEKTFLRVLSNLKFAIENELRPKWLPICQEIYNWIQDNQKNDLKNWMIEFDPQRTKYYFDNDGKDYNYSTTSSIPDDKIDEYEDEE